MNKILHGEALKMLKTFDDESVDMCLTSPPYWNLRDYQVEGQLGLEKTPEEYINRLCNIFDEVKRVLKPKGTCWVVIGDTYSSQRWTGNGKGQPMNKFKDGHRDINPERITNLPPKCLVQIPALFSIEMCYKRGWILRNEIIWAKPACMPSSANDRFTVDYEKVFFFSKNTDYYFKTQYEPLAEASIQRAKTPWVNKGGKLDQGQLPITSESFNKAILKMIEKGKRNKRCVWKIPYKQFRQAHFATYPEKLCETPIAAGCPVNGIVLDPFFGAGTTGLVALKQNKRYIGIELNKDYIQIAENRLKNIINPFFQ